MGKIGFGLVGCGRISRNHLSSLKKIPDVEIIAVCDADKKRLEECGEKYSCKTYDSYDAFLQDTDINVVSICTPSGLHAQMALQATAEGKHILLEKPMAMSLKEADAIIAAAKEKGVKLGIVFQNRFNRAVTKLRSALDAGKFGVLTHGAAVVRWNRNDEYYKQSPWRGTWSQDGGCLMNQSIHTIDLLLWMMGPAESVFAYADTKLRNIEGEDNAVAVVKFKNGAFATIEASTTIYPTNLEGSLHIFGTTGSACVGGVATNKIKAWRFADEDEDEVTTAQDKEPPNVYGFGHADIIIDFVKSLKNGQIPSVTGEEGRKALELILAIYHSARLNKEVKLPLKEEFCIGVGID